MKRIDFTLEEVLDDIKRVNLECGSCSFTIYERKGRYSPQLFKRKLGVNFTDIKQMLGLSCRKYNYKKQEIIDDIIKIYDMLGYMTKDTYLEHGKYSRKPIDRHFGSWNKMLKELGLPINCEINITEHDLLAELKKHLIMSGQ